MNNVPEAQGWVAGEHDTRLAEVAAEVAVDARVVLQLVGLNQLINNSSSKMRVAGPLYQQRILDLALQ